MLSALNDNALVTDTKKTQLVLDFVSRTLRLPPLRWFPAPHPISLDCAALSSMQAPEWMCALKLDGTRVLLVCMEYESGKFASVLMGRNMQMWRVQLRGGKTVMQKAILDGELMGEDLHLFDDLTLYDSVTDYRTRWDSVNAFCEAVGGISVNLHAKPIYPAQEAARVFVEAAHPNDGIVFTRDVPMHEFSKRTSKMLKWKPEHSVDLAVRAGALLWRSDSNVLEPVEFEYRISWGSAGPKSDAICEFVANYKRSGLRLKFLREREHVNNKQTVLKTLDAALEALDIATIGAVLKLN
jgi:hypothetical protein